MTPEQFDGWFAYYRLRPWGDDWRRSSRTTAALINTIRETTPRDKAMKKEEYLDDDIFIPAWSRPGESPAEKEIVLQCVAADAIEGFGV